MPAAPRVIFVNRFYWPDEPATAQLLTDLAEALAARGHSVTVLAAQPLGRQPDPGHTHNGVNLLRAGGGSGRSSLLAKAVSFLSFSVRAHRLLSSWLRPGDILVLMTDPPLLNIAATSLAKKRGARVVHWLQDIYPEIAQAVGRGVFAGPLARRRDRAWQAADVCVVPGDDMARFARSRGVGPDALLVSPNWAPAGLEARDDAAVEQLRKDWGLVGKFVVMYSGNLGRVHDLDSILAAAEALRGERDIVFLLVGGGAQKARLQAAATRRKLDGVQFRPGQPRIRLGTTLALAQLHLITLKEGCESFVFPSKFYGIAAAGRPILYIGPRQCELARTIAGRDLGRVFSRDETVAVAQTIRHLRHAPADCARMSRAALAFAAANGRLENAVAVWDRLLSGLETMTPPALP